MNGYCHSTTWPFTNSASGRTCTCTARRRPLYRRGGSPTAQPTHTRVARVGVEPTGTRLSTWPLCRFAYHAIGQYDVRESNPSCLRERQATSPEVERRIDRQSARWESNPLWTVWKTAAVPPGSGHITSFREPKGRRVVPSRFSLRRSGPAVTNFSFHFEAGSTCGRETFGRSRRPSSPLPTWDGPRRGARGS